MQALAYRPVGDEFEVALEAVKLAAALTTLADKVVRAARLAGSGDTPLRAG